MHRVESSDADTRLGVVFVLGGRLYLDGPVSGVIQGDFFVEEFIEIVECVDCEWCVKIDEFDEASFGISRSFFILLLLPFWLR